MALDGANIEMRHIGNHPDQAELKQMLREHKKAFTQLTQEYQTKKSQLIKSELLGDHEEKKGQQETAEGSMEHGLAVQEKSKESLKRTIELLIKLNKLAQILYQNYHKIPNKLSKCMMN